METLSQASEELRAKETGEREECLRITGIDEIEIYSVEEDSDCSVEVIKRQNRMEESFEREQDGVNGRGGRINLG